MQVRFQSRLSRQRWSFIIMYRYVDGTASRRKRKSITSALYLSLSLALTNYLFQINDQERNIHSSYMNTNNITCHLCLTFGPLKTRWASLVFIHYSTAHHPISLWALEPDILTVKWKCWYLNTPKRCVNISWINHLYPRICWKRA